MPELAQAAPQPAQAAEPVEVMEVPAGNSEEYAEWRLSGNLPKKAPAQAAPQPAKTEKSPGDATDPAVKTAPKAPEKRRPDIEERFRAYSEQIRQLRQELQEAKATRNPSQEPTTYAEWRKAFSPNKWTEEYLQKNTEATLEEAIQAMTDYTWDVRETFDKQAQEGKRRLEASQKALDDARKTYANFDEVAGPAVRALMEADAGKRLNPEVGKRLNGSKFLPHILYILGGSEETLSRFLEVAGTNPDKALDALSDMEYESRKALEKGRSSKQEGAILTQPKPQVTPPPIDIPARASGAMDESERALEAIEKGDPNAFLRWKRSEDRKDLARRRGV